MWFFKAFLWILITGYVFAEQIWKNSNAIRSIDLRSTFVKETTSLIIVNEGNEPQTVYRYHQHVNRGEEIAKIEAVLKDHSKKKAQLTQVDDVSFDIFLETPVQPGESRTITVRTSLIHGFRPLPSAIDQDDSQFLVYKTSRFLDSLYSTEQQRTRFILPSSNVESYTTYDESPARNGNTIVYETRSFVLPGDNSEEIQVRYEHTTPLPNAIDFHMQVEFHQYRQKMDVSERIVLENRSAKLKTPFDRARWYMKNFYNPISTAINRFLITLPSDVSDVSYTDEVGNITTSHMRTEPQQTVLELLPRYPVFGGWNYLYNLGWSMPYSTFTTHEDGQIFIKLPLTWVPGELFFEKASWSYVFPEGASNISVKLPVEADSSNVNTVHKFLDTKGRQVYTFEASNVVDGDPSQIVEISYSFDNSVMYMRVAIITALLLILATSVYLIWAP
ncbi:dolichyl-diphospho-oligosaccharide-protein glycosyltransferase [Schizosaccharomyces cryophilus OY26]|uniref:Dolichyl-diphosphooligosaccharide--protein glycosyltransferase subunit 1 n=1 Tax=Schizosaccharomyces cryophilus (strain OY26 / ATCC MYA-4695 / CBS 11777 / NBRC 106824 / NRRL Y48691) TaxID=653667 RepID=S9W0L5_SCHCR|nr:dolichyl-diphospho-oligosaccharide-protein glycosyltransferase [Schizosaccharomyces cryophilus OY26]EPY51959.1 dolichyl-diphospho-oligosaccharide-protein glycosyltransferase [Schizosaccharomyces cryophilus OY26]